MDVRISLIVLSSLIYVTPAWLTAQTTPQAYQGELELGLGFTNEDSFKFGEFTGINNDGIYALGNINLSSSMDSKAGDSSYWSLSGSKLGLDSRELNVEYGKQGHFSLSLDYQELPQNRFADAMTPFLGAGSASQTLPSSWIAANSTAGFTNLFDSLNTQAISTERRRFGGGISWLFSRNWELAAQFRHEVKEGNSPMAAIFASNGGNPRGVSLAAPVDYDTNSLDLSVTYTGPAAHFSLAYYLSVFNNANQGLLWDNPYLRPTGNTWVPGTDYASGARGQLALPPDNRAERINFSGAYRFGTSTRLNANISYGWMEQNQAYLPYTINSSLNVPEDLPRGSLDGRIENWYIDVGLTSRPLRKLDIRANYNYDKRDNETPRALYQLVLNDSGNQGALVSSGSRLNTPYSFSTQRFELESGYRLIPKSKLSIGYKYEQRDRDYTEVKTTDEHFVWIKLRSNIMDNTSGWLKFIHSERDGSTYISNQPFLDGHNPDYIDTLLPNERFMNDPLLRKYNYANRERDEITGSLNIVTTESLSFSLTGIYGKDDYNKSEIGLQDRQDTSITLDSAYVLNKMFSAHAFITLEDLEYNQQGYQRANVPFFPGVPREPTPCTSCGFWQVMTNDEITTAGIGFERWIIQDKFKLKTNYTYSSSVTNITPQADPLVEFEKLPSIKSKLHSFNVTGDYQVRENIKLRLRYLYERFNMYDFATDGLEVNTLSNVLGFGAGSLDYNAHVFGLSVIYQIL